MKKRILILFLVTIAIAFAGTCIACTSESKSSHDDDDGYSGYVPSSSVDSSYYEDVIRGLENENEELRTDNASLKADVQIWQDIAWEYEDAFNFLMEEVVIVDDDGYDYYHYYDCPEIDWSYYWAFNIEYAEYKGYSPCPYCR